MLTDTPNVGMLKELGTVFLVLFLFGLPQAFLSLQNGQMLRVRGGGSDSWHQNDAKWGRNEYVTDP